MLPRSKTSARFSSACSVGTSDGLEATERAGTEVEWKTITFSFTGQDVTAIWARLHDKTKVASHDDGDDDDDHDDDVYDHDVAFRVLLPPFANEETHDRVYYYMVIYRSRIKISVLLLLQKAFWRVVEEQDRRQVRINDNLARMGFQCAARRWVLWKCLRKIFLDDGNG